jgi:hypothetical protein
MSTSERKERTLPAWERVRKLVLAVDHMIDNNIVWHDDRDIETLHADFYWTHLQSWILKYFRIEQKMSAIKIAAFLNVTRQTVHGWLRKSDPDQMKGPALHAAFSKARGRFKEDFISNEITTEELHVWALVALIEYVRAKYFDDLPPVRHRLNEEIVKMIAYIMSKKMILWIPLTDEGGPEFFGVVRGFPLTSKLTDEQIADVLEDWLKPYITVYLESRSLFDARIVLKGYR